ncbi:MAG: enoyl-ACP reductase [Phycisphaerales bacterium]|jgi:enoyl-[acyl-carrier protein] reductase I|nr:enoyl-ACP reductase [Phycisphaerales bacterium]
MDGKTGLVVGVANDRSYAWFIAQSIIREGGTCLFTHLPGEKMERRVRKAIDSLGIQDPWLRPMDASTDESMDELFDQLSSEHERLDYLVHSIAFADREWLKEGNFTPTPREVFKQAMDISAWTYAGMAHRASPMMADGGGMVSMSYYGAEKAVPGYNVMGVAKAALEATTRYLAMELGEKNIRVNSISGGPIRTMSSMAVGGFSQILDWVEQKSPLRRNVTGDDVGDTAAWLCSPRASGITGQTIYVDCGYSSMGL